MYRSEIVCIAVGPDGAGFGRPPPISPAGPRSPHKTAAVQTAGSGSLGLLWTAAWEGPVPKASPDHSRTGFYESGFGKISEGEMDFLGDDVKEMIRNGKIARASQECLEFIKKHF